jgi:hypothetical protein
VVAAASAGLLGGTGGVARTAEVAYHGHVTATDGNHSHKLKASCSGGCNDGNDGFARGCCSLDSNTFSTVDNSAVTNHSHAVQAGGTGADAQNMPPYVAMSYIIKF